MFFAVRRIVPQARSFQRNAHSLGTPLTKIVATIGPASENMPMLQHVADAGMRIMRINFSHATYEEADLRVANLKLCAGNSSSDAHGDKNIRAVMLDTQGPEIRTGSFSGDIKELEIKIGDPLVLSINADVRNNQTAGKIWISYDKLLNTVKSGTRILLDDGAIEVKVESISKAQGVVNCKVLNTGVLGNKKGVNIPGEVLEIPALSEKDKIDLRWGIQNDVDFIAASFVRKASDVSDIRDYASALIKEYAPGRPLPRIISKIESTEALDNFDSILAISDAIMVARGDLGVEIPMELIANWQKEIVRKCNRVGKPVIVATQMLESMQKNPRPTRAECTDVYNAVLDGADCVMLSGESAKGKYPTQAVGTMNKIVHQAEVWTKANPIDASVVQIKPEGLDTAHGVAYAIAEASKNLHAKCIIVLAVTGQTAANIAAYRPNVPIVTFVPEAKTGRFLQLHRGIHPVVSSGADLSSTSPLAGGRFDLAASRAKALGFCGSGDNVIIVAAEPGAGALSKAITMRVATVA